MLSKTKLQIMMCAEKERCETMEMFVNPGNEAFAVALNSEIYVDKTGLLTYTNKVMNTLQGYICNSRPRRFGKSITANMLTAYYSKGCDSEEMFSNLKISASNSFKKHLNQYDVIHVDIQWCMEVAGGAENIVSFLTENIIKELKSSYQQELIHLFLFFLQNCMLLLFFLLIKLSYLYIRLNAV